MQTRLSTEERQAEILAAALRLARFNVNIGVVDKRYFQGMPSPAAAAMVMGLSMMPNFINATCW